MYSLIDSDNLQGWESQFRVVDLGIPSNLFLDKLIKKKLHGVQEVVRWKKKKYSLKCLQWF